jgi:hypothetical protein
MHTITIRQSLWSQDYKLFFYDQEIERAKNEGASVYIAKSLENTIS